MKTQIDIITGFLGSGKTSLINGLLQSDLLAKENIVIIQCEVGEEELVRDTDDRNIYIERVEKNNQIDSIFIMDLIKEQKPDRIIIETNGIQNIEDLLIILEDNSLRRICSINKFFHVTNSATFDVFMNNMGSIVVGQILSSDIIIINNIEKLPINELRTIEKTLRNLNEFASILGISSKDEFSHVVDSEAIDDKEGKLFLKPSDKLFIVFLSFLLVYFLWNIGKSYVTTDIISKIYVFNTVFISILVQAFPFILIGVFISSIIQVFVSQEAIVRFFPKNKFVAFIVAIASGFVFPVCDCAIVPVAGRLVKKGVPLPIAITFMLTAPIVNPIVIASTFYAFPGQTWVGLYRIYLGITVAVSVGLTFMFFPEEKPILKSNIDSFSCGCDFCSNEYGKIKGMMGKLEAIFMHAQSEFFVVGKFLVIGAFLSTLFQTAVLKEMLSSIGGESWLSLLIMMLAAFVLSICSTSDAFIARSFTSQFPINSVMGFLVLGPMIDIKNLLMLLGTFEKRFVIKLVVTIFSLAFIIIYAFTSIMGGM